jgi:putative protease
MAGRDANKGDCAQSCRWNYYLVEEKRPNEYYPVVETEEGTFFFNSKDLCMIEYLPELIRSGLASLKIEGRNKSVYYVANIVRVYREAIDTFYKDPENYVFKPEWLDEIKKASHRDFTTGFYHNRPNENDQHYTSSAYVRGFDFTGLVKSYDPETKLALVEQRNRMVIGDDLEVMGPNYYSYKQTIHEMFDLAGKPIEVAPHAQQLIYIRMDQPVKELNILRRERKDDSFE